MHMKIPNFPTPAEPGNIVKSHPAQANLKLFLLYIWFSISVYKLTIQWSLNWILAFCLISLFAVATYLDFRRGTNHLFDRPEPTHFTETIIIHPSISGQIPIIVKTTNLATFAFLFFRHFWNPRSMKTMPKYGVKPPPIRNLGAQVRPCVKTTAESTRTWRKVFVWILWNFLIR